MGFLDNSGDIILDAVLTDTGRMRLARGDGSFKITKFALADDEINYELYRNANHVDGAHASGSAYYDLEILQTPVLEAFTDNIISLKSKLMSHTRTNLLYLPIIKVNDAKVGTAYVKNKNHATFESAPTANTFLVAVDRVTEVAFSNQTQGVMFGANPNQQFIKVEQGLDTADVSPTTLMDRGLVENQYIVEIDNRLGAIIARNGEAIAPSFIDDDQIANYRLSLATHSSFVQDISGDSGDYTLSETALIQGPRGTQLTFKIRSSLELQRSNYLFTKFGNNFGTGWPTKLTTGNRVANNNLDTRAAANELKYIDSIIRISGATTGYRIDVPVRFVKCTTCTDK